MRARTAILPLCLLLGISATTPDESYQVGGEWEIRITPLQLPAAIKGAKGYTKKVCRPPLGMDSFPKVGRVKQLAPGVLCTVTEMSAPDQPYRRVDECRREGQAAPRRISYVGEQSPALYSLTITTEEPGRADLKVVVREDGKLLGPCQPPSP